jgi:crotonobetainyl-CoA:carnitine CoA-transferase CaiB-like acyl-CoA transferase
VTASEPSHGPLAGVRVLKLGNFIAAPFAGMVFADFGADVIKVERPGRGEEPAVKEGLLMVNVALVELPPATGKNRSCGP